MVTVLRIGASDGEGPPELTGGPCFYAGEAVRWRLRNAKLLYHRVVPYAIPSPKHGRIMSIKIMSRVWDNGPPDKAETLVLLAIADFCNDYGECWPSVGGIARKARMTERGVQKIIARLVGIGWLKIDKNAGRRGCNLYLVTPPELSSPRTPFTPNTVRQPPNPVPPTPEPRSPEPSYNHQEPSKSNDAREVQHILCQWASTQAVQSFVAYQRKQKGKALTVTAAKRQATQLERIFQAGGDTDDALGLAEERGWQSVQADWYFKSKEQGNGHGNHNSGRSAHGRANGPDPALEQIARITGLSGTFRDGGF